MAKQDPAPSRKELLEELTFLRQQAGSLTMRGRYTECAKLIEDNLERVWEAERWPEDFFAFLTPFQRCYPALNRSESLEEYLAKVLEKKGIPALFATFFAAPPARWSAEYFREQAMDAKTARKPELALDWCDLAIKADAANSNLLLLRGWILEDMDRGKEALEAFQQSLELNERNYKASQGIARQYAKTNLRKALEYIEEGIAQYPDEAGFVAEKADILLRLGKPDSALEWYDKAAEMDPYNPQYPYQKAELLLSQDKEMAAVPLYKRAIALNGKHVPSLWRMAVLLAPKQPSQALEYCTIAVGQEPANIEAGMLRATLLVRLGDSPGAVKQYDDILLRDPDNTDALAGLGGCLLRQDPQKSLECFDKALSLASGRPDLHMGRGRACKALNKWEDAVAAFTAVTGLDKRDHKALFQLYLLHREKDREAALGFLDRAIALAPEEAEYHGERGALLRDMDRLQEAIDSLHTACKLDPGNAQYHFQLAVLLQADGKRASAIQNYREAASLSPSLAEAHRRLAEMLLYSEPETALAHINAAIGVDVANPRHYFLKSRIIAQLQEDERALGVLKQRMEEGDGTGNEAYDEVGTLLAGNILQVAMMHLARAIELDPANTTYLCFRGHLLYRMGKQGQALAEYQGLLRKDGNNHEALYGVACILAAKKDPKAMDNLDRAIALSPSTAAYHAKKAALLAEDPDRYEEAIQCYDVAIPLDTWSFEPILEKARLLDRHGDLYPAIASYRRVLLVNPNCLEATRRLGELLCDLRPDAAWHYIEHAMALSPGNWRFQARAARILQARGKEAEARAACDEALALAREDPAAPLELARLFAGRYPAIALPFALQAAEAAPKSGEPRFLCGSLFLALDDLDNAQKSYEEAADLGYTEGGAREKAVELLYRQGRPEALEAAGTLPDTPEGLLLKAKILDSVPVPPDTAGALALIADAVKEYPDDLPLREFFVELLRKKKSFLRVPIENAKLEALRRRLRREEEEAVHVEEVTFETEQEDGK